MFSSVFRAMTCFQLIGGASMLKLWSLFVMSIAFVGLDSHWRMLLGADCFSRLLFLRLFMFRLQCMHLIWGGFSLAHMFSLEDR